MAANPECLKFSVMIVSSSGSGGRHISLTSVWICVKIETCARKGTLALSLFEVFAGLCAQRLLIGINQLLFFGPFVVPVLTRDHKIRRHSTFRTCPKNFQLIKNI